MPSILRLGSSSLRHSVVPRVAAFGLALVLAGGSVANAGYEETPPDQSSGTPGSVQILDSAGSPGVTCRYGGSPAKLVRFVVQPPSVTWPNRHPANNTEHGTVTYQILIQRESGVDSNVWQTRWKSAKQSATVYESSWVPFQLRKIPWVHQGSQWYRLLIKLVWLTPNGVVGTRRHWYQWYLWTGATTGSVGGGCVNQTF